MTRRALLLALLLLPILLSFTLSLLILLLALPAIATLLLAPSLLSGTPVESFPRSGLAAVAAAVAARPARAGHQSWDRASEGTWTRGVVAEFAHLLGDAVRFRDLAGTRHLECLEFSGEVIQGDIGCECA